MAGVDAAGLAIGVTHICFNLACGLYSIIDEVGSASEDARRMQRTLAALHTRLDQVRSLFDENAPQSHREKDYRDSIIITLKKIDQDLSSLRTKLRIDEIVDAGNRARLKTWAVIQRIFDTEEIRNIKERLAGFEAHLQSHLEILSILMLFNMRTEFRTEFRELGVLIRPILKKLLQDATAREGRQRSDAADSRSIQSSLIRSGSICANVNILSQNNSDFGYYHEFELWKRKSEDMIESVIETPWHQVANSRYAPSISEERHDGVSITPTAQDSTEMNRTSTLPKFFSGLYPVAETTDEPSYQGITQEALDWCRQQGYPVDRPNFRCDISDDTIPGELKGVSPIHQAIKKGDMRVLEQILSWSDCNADVRLRDWPEDATPFLLACSKRSLSAVKLLVAKGVQVDAKTSTGKTGLHLCQSSTSGRGRLAIAELLLEDPKAKALDVNAQDRFGMTAAHIAATVGDVKMIEYLFYEKEGKRSANADVQQQDGSTPLMVALKSNIVNKRQVVELLAEHSNLEIKNNKGKSAEKIAREHGEKDIYRYLKAQMPEGNTSSRRTSDATTVVSGVSTQGSKDVCGGCKQHCPQWKDYALSIKSSVFSPDWAMSLRRYS
ncbi:hypothetical protein HG530_015702 [Fusarium avenaceum]|nr:hypothetical protein HG530_015702 [Fusarium avenaceum]